MARTWLSQETLIFGYLGLPAFLLSLAAGGSLLLLSRLQPRLERLLSARPHRLPATGTLLTVAAAGGLRRTAKGRVTIQR
jgi:hypothetical protein